MYDPLGMISPITVQFKNLFQELCKDKKDWDEPLEGSCKSIWQTLVTQLQGVKPLTLPRCYYAGTEGEVIASDLNCMGFAMHQLRHMVRQVWYGIRQVWYVRFVSSKTRVPPLSE